MPGLALNWDFGHRSYFMATTIIDQIGYQLLSQYQPGIIAAIAATLERGGTAQEIERRLLARFGFASMTAQLTIGAAYWLEAQRAQPAGEKEATNGKA
jgi:hypothetical protein